MCRLGSLWYIIVLEELVIKYLGKNSNIKHTHDVIPVFSIMLPNVNVCLCLKYLCIVSLQYIFHGIVVCGSVRMLLYFSPFVCFCAICLSFGLV